jgi:hypothetical protein
MPLLAVFGRDAGKRDRGARRAGMNFHQCPAAVEDQIWQ